MDPSHSLSHTQHTHTHSVSLTFRRRKNRTPRQTITSRLNTALAGQTNKQLFGPVDYPSKRSRIRRHSVAGETATDKKKIQNNIFARWPFMKNVSQTRYHSDDSWNRRKTKNNVSSQPNRRWAQRWSHKYGYPRRALNEYWIITLYKTLGEASTVSQVNALLLLFVLRTIAVCRAVCMMP